MWSGNERKWCTYTRTHSTTSHQHQQHQTAKHFLFDFLIHSTQHTKFVYVHDALQLNNNTENLYSAFFLFLLFYCCSTCDLSLTNRYEIGKMSFSIHCCVSFCLWMTGWLLCVYNVINIYWNSPKFKLVWGRQVKN